MANPKLHNKNGKFKKGNPGKPKGAVSSEKRAAAEAIKAIVDERADRLLRIVDELEDKDFLNTWLHLVEYVQPKLSRVEQKNTGSQTLHIKKEINES